MYQDILSVIVFCRDPKALDRDIFTDIDFILEPTLSFSL